MIAPTIRAVFFDAVGTLLHPDPAVAIAYRTVGVRYGSRLSLAEVDVRFRAAFQREEVVDRAGEHRTSTEREVARWRSIVAAVLDDESDAEACFRELFAHFAQPSAWRVNDEVEPTLRQLAERGLLVGIASNFDERLHHLVACIPGLAAVRHVLVSSEIGWKKPAAPFFAEVIRVSGVRAEEILFVGDDRENDYLAARSAGMEAVLLDSRGRDGLAGDKRITRLTELLT